MELTASDGLRLSYYIDDFSDPWRKADTVLLLHSAMGSSKRFYGMVPALARRFKVVRLDLRGHGQSQVPPGDPPLTMARLVDDVIDLLAHLGDRAVARQHVVDAGLFVVHHHAQVQRRVRLWVEVDQANSLPGFGQGRAKIDSRGRLADAPLLIQDGDRTHGEAPSSS